MGSFAHPVAASSPIIAIPQHAPPPTKFAMSPPEQAGAQDIAPAPAEGRRMAGRKRSRDEAAPNLAEEAPEPAQEVEAGWEYGEGMVLIKPVQGYVADASSQSGTWVEEQKARDQAAAATVVASQRPEIRSNKSQRMDHPAASSPGTIPVVNGRGVMAMDKASGQQIDLAEPATTSATDNASHPVVDDFTLHLGIGWRKISQDEHIQAAARGWSRYIENHYPLSAVTLRLESRGLQAYLVEATEGFFLFAEDLRQGQLVSTRADVALQNLKCSPPVFEGTEVLTAAESPGATAPSDAAPTFRVGLQTDTMMN
ncbi:hypothetical protein VDGD_04068 [Verticillium dahliae]|nr:hypothetical protein VdG1_01997 [Verticillium dahliae VDG1]RBQ88884.1 hypothetical protein VDGD_04068 [Verticillium dahliae]